MNAALLAAGYAVAVAWCVPVLLLRLTAGGVSARLGLAAWVAAMASVLTCAVAAVRFLVKAAITDWPWLAEAVCRSVTGRACAAAVYRSAAFELAVSLTAIIAALAATTVAWGYARLAEMCADDAAARHSGRSALLAALLTMGTGQTVPTAALAATAGAVTARVQRLIDPPRQARQARNQMALGAVLAVLIAATGLVTLR